MSARGHQLACSGREYLVPPAEESRLCRALPRPPVARRTGEDCPMSAYQMRKLPLGRRAGLASSVPIADHTPQFAGFRHLVSLQKDRSRRDGGARALKWHSHFELDRQLTGPAACARVLEGPYRHQIARPPGFIGTTLLGRPLLAFGNSNSSTFSASSAIVNGFFRTRCSMGSSLVRPTYPVI